MSLPKVRFPCGVIYSSSLYSYSCIEDEPLVEFMYRVFTRMIGESYCKRLRSLLCVR